MDNTQNLTDGMHMLVDAFLMNGLDKMYGVVGIPVTDLARIAQGKGIRYIGVRHESDAGHAASIAGYINGKPGLFLTVSAPGFLNGIVALKEATENGFPVIQISGSSTRNLVDMGEGDYEGLDQFNFAKPFCKAAYRIDRVEDIPLGVARAIRAASSGRPGGVYLDLPADLLAGTMDADAAKALMYKVDDPKPAMIPSTESVQKALDLLKNAKNPLIILGKGAAQAMCDEKIKNFVEQTGIPYLPMSFAKGLLPDDHPQSAASARGLTLKTADVVMLIGARLNWMLNFGNGPHWNPDVKFIQLDIDPMEIDNSRYIAAPVVGDITSSMTLFLEGLKNTPIKVDPAWMNAIKANSEKNNAKFAAKITDPSVPMNHFNALGAVKKVIDEHPEIYIANEGANTLDDCRNIIDMRLPRHRLDCGTWGVMGVGLGYAIAAAVETGQQVVSIHGDSAFGFDGMEVETIARYNLPVCVMVFNNGGIYRGDFQNIGTDGDPSPLTLMASAHYEKMMEAFGGQGFYAKTPEDVEKYLRMAIESRKPTLINVELSIHAGVESGHIGNLNPQPVTGPLSPEGMAKAATAKESVAK